MPRMIDLIRASKVPSNLVQSAARGALSIPPQEMIEILVHLATRNKVFAERAQLTLASWDEASSRTVAADPQTPKAVLDYFIDPQNLRPALLPALLENPSVADEALAELAAAGSREIGEAMLNSPRVGRTHSILASFSSNPNLTETQSAAVHQKLASAPPARAAAAPLSLAHDRVMSSAAEQAPSGRLSPSAVISEVDAAISEVDAGEVPDQLVASFLTEHAAEISAEPEKPFAPIGAIHSEHGDEDATEALADSGEVAAVGAEGSAAAAKRAPIQKKSFLGAGHEKGSALQKIAKLDVKGRIQLAMKGDKEERSLLIRDGTKVVALAVLESPKITDAEVEKFASQKNVLEAVLRAIPMKRRFMKIYPVVRNLVFNPRTPIDVSLGLMKHLLTLDLRNLAGNKDVSDTVRKLAAKMFRTKLESSSGGKK